MLNQVAQRLRDLLHQGTLVAYYFENDGRKSVSCDFWADGAGRRRNGVGHLLAVRQAGASSLEDQGKGVMARRHEGKNKRVARDFTDFVDALVSAAIRGEANT